MEETMLEEKAGFFGRVLSKFTRTDVYEEEVDQMPEKNTAVPGLRRDYRYTVTVRRQITSFDDAVAAAHGLKRGEQQIINLTATEPVLRQKIVDFMSGVNFAHEGTWEEIGEAIYLVVPQNAYVEVAPATARTSALRN
jgi:cell division inhibitor SepF